MPLRLLLLTTTLAAPPTPDSASTSYVQEIPLGSRGFDEGDAGWTLERTASASWKLDNRVGHGAPPSARITSADQEGAGRMLRCAGLDGRGGETLRLSGWVRTRDVQGEATLWMRLDGDEGVLAYEDLWPRGLRDDHPWSMVRVDLGIPEQAREVCVGARLDGEGTAWFDDLHLVVSPPLGAPDTTPLDARAVDRLLALARLWSAVGSHHPGLASRRLDWDAALLAAVPEVEAADDPADFEAALRRLVAPLGPAIRLGGPRPTPPPPSIERYDDEVIRIVPGGALPDLTDVTAVILDLRAGAPLPRELTTHLLRGSVRLPPVEHVRHQGPGEDETRSSSGLSSVPGPELHGKSEVRLPVWILTDMDSDPRAGDGVLALRRSGQARVVGEHFLPWPGEQLRVELGDGFHAEVPLALYRDGAIAPDLHCDGALAVDVARSDIRGEAAAWRDPLVPLPPLPDHAVSHHQRHARLADHIAAWSALGRASPNLPEHWPTVLRDHLDQAARAADPDASLCSLSRLVAVARDGQAVVHVPGTFPDHRTPDLALAWVEQGVAVATVGEGPAEAGIQPGMVLTAVDGVPVEEVLEAALAEESASTDATRRRFALDWLLVRRGEQVVELELVGPDERPIQVQVPAEAEVGGLSDLPPHPEVVDLGAGLTYLDLTRLELSAWEERLPELREGAGVVLDLRGAAGEAVGAAVTSLLRRPVQAPLVDVPVAEGPSTRSWVSESWTARPRRPRVESPAVVLADSRTMGRAESWLAIVRHGGVAPIVGEPTAGTSGRVAFVDLPAGARLRFTGVRVRKPDGTPLQGVGIAPDVQVVRSREGLEQGRDEVLEAAIQVLRGE